MLNLKIVGCAVAVLVLAVTGCQCGSPPITPGTGGGNGGAGGNSGGGGGDGVGGGDGTGGGNTGGGPMIIVDPNDLGNAAKDSDCDGLSDAEEFGNTYPGGKRTDPANADSDGDGIKDGVEVGRTSSVDTACGFVGDAEPNSRTVPTENDSDTDGVRDGVEDTNKNGAVENGETDPSRPDSDGDGLKDGEEDVNANGVVDTGETDPRKRDTDGDFINDGVEKNVTQTDPTKADTDGDMCIDSAEDTDQDGTKDMGETDPNDASDCGVLVNPDSDSDGILDRVEDADGDGVVDANETDPNNPDTDGDMLKDGEEDANHNGQLDVGETNPKRKDTDCDGLLDGPTIGMVRGEDLNGNGMLDVGETDPKKRDTDGDGISDGVELGLQTANIADALNCVGVTVDADGNSTTDPRTRDSDGDGIDDGAEDVNQNGKADPGELDPKVSDMTGPAIQVCTAAKLRPVVFASESDPDIQLGLPSTFTEIQTMTVGGSKRGVIGYDPTNKVAFLAWRQAPPGGATTATADEASLLPAITMEGPVSPPLTQSFQTWDQIQALQAFYTQTQNTDVKAHANALANRLVGAGAGTLTGMGGVNGNFMLQAEYIHRTNGALVVLIALTPVSNYTGEPLFSMSDAAGGSAVAQFGDATAVQCEKFGPSTGKIDFLFVVDDSGSMASSQNALASTATAVANALNNSSLDWRIALVTTSYHVSGEQNSNRLRGFVAKGDANAVSTFQGWLTANVSCTDSGQQCGNGGACRAVNAGWVGICGSGSEGLLGAARDAIDDITPATMTTLATRVRADAQLVVVLLGDADDQTTGYSSTSSSCVRTGSPACEAISNFTNFFSGTANMAPTNKLGSKIVVHGIVCPEGPDTDSGRSGIQTCNGEDQASPQRHAQIISASQGVRGSISDSTSIGTSVNRIINAAIAASGYKMKKPPIGASVKVAMSQVLNGANCNKDNIPRSTTHGFDFDGINQTLSLFGDCRPAAGTQEAAVSYKYWVDTTPNPGGNPPPCSMDPFYTTSETDFCLGKLTCNLQLNVCECPPDCGGNGPAGKVCNPNRLVCDFVCTADCGGTCGSFEQCNTTDCSCECLQTATCGLGYRFQNGAGVCGCVCDTASLNCGATYQPDANACACVCKPDCGGCSSGEICNPSTCSCGVGIN